MDKTDSLRNNINLLKKHVGELKSLLQTQREERDALKQNFIGGGIYVLLIKNEHMMNLVNLHILEQRQLKERQAIETRHSIKKSVTDL